jgi:hypothetical protein
MRTAIEGKINPSIPVWRFARCRRRIESPEKAKAAAAQKTRSASLESSNIQNEKARPDTK